MECGIDAARRRAIAPTNGTPASMRSCCALVRVCFSMPFFQGKGRANTKKHVNTNPQRALKTS